MAAHLDHCAGAGTPADPELSAAELVAHPWEVFQVDSASLAFEAHCCRALALALTRSFARCYCGPLAVVVAADMVAVAACRSIASAEHPEELADTAFVVRHPLNVSAVVHGHRVAERVDLEDVLNKEFGRRSVACDRTAVAAENYCHQQLRRHVH